MRREAAKYHARLGRESRQQPLTEFIVGKLAGLVRRARLDRHDLQVLARANALRPLTGGKRRSALWLPAAAVPDRNLLRCTARDDVAPALPLAFEGARIVFDYRAMDFALGRHPLALLRERLKMGHLQSATHCATDISRVRVGSSRCGRGRARRMACCS